MKKGFIFVETIVVVAFLTTALLLIYTSFIQVLVEEKQRNSFDDTAYIYRTYYIEDFLVSLNLEDYIYNHLETEVDGVKPLVTMFNCGDLSLYNLRDVNNNIIQSEVDKQKFCEAIINGGRFDVVNIYITRYDVSELSDCVEEDSIICKKNDELRNLSSGVISYIKTLSGFDDGYRLIIEYKDQEDNYYYSNVKIAKRG